MVFDPGSPGSIVSAMPDGTSNTIMIAHYLKDCNSDAQPIEGGDGVTPQSGGLITTDWASTPNDMYWGIHCLPSFGYKDYAKAKGVTTAVPTTPFNPRSNRNFYSSAPNFSLGSLPFQVRPAKMTDAFGTCIL